MDIIEQNVGVRLGSCDMRRDCWLKRVSVDQRVGEFDIRCGLDSQGVIVSQSVIRFCAAAGNRLEATSIQSICSDMLEQQAGAIGFTDFGIGACDKKAFHF